MPTRKWEGETLVHTSTSRPQFDSHVAALRDGGFVVVWYDPYLAEIDDVFWAEGAVRAQRYDAAGAPVGEEILVIQSRLVQANYWDYWEAWNRVDTPSVTGLADGGFQVNWLYGGHSQGRVYDSNGVVVPGHALEAQPQPTVAWLNSAQFAVVSEHTSSSTGIDVTVRIFTGDIATSTPLTGDIPVNSTTAGNQTHPAITALPNGGFVVAWEDRSGTGVDGDGIRLQVFDGSGNRIGGETIVNTTTVGLQSQPSLAALADGRVVVTWTDSSAGSHDIRTQIIDPRDGIVTGTAASETLYGHDFVNDEISAGAGNDTLHGLRGNDMLFGGAGDDILIGGVGADRLDGGAGTDTASYQDATAGVTASLAAPATNTGEAAGDRYVSVENLTGSAFNDTLAGDADANLIKGGKGNDHLVGGAGNDLLDGGPGADTLDGGAGIDSVSYQNATAGITADLANPALNKGDPAGDTYVSIEKLTGSVFNDVLTGDANVNTLIGGKGADKLTGGADNDFLEGGAGADKLDGGAGSDTASYQNASAGVTANLANPVLNKGDAAGDTYVSIENLIGSAYNDVLVGNSGANVLRGGYGDDIYLVDNAGDRIIEISDHVAGLHWVTGGNDRVSTSVSYTLTAGQQIELLKTTNAAGTAALNLTGNDYGQSIFGNAGDNTLNGGGGADTLTGGGGHDTFLFDAPSIFSSYAERITDFTHGVDKIALENTLFTGLTGIGALASGAFYVGTAAHDSDDRIIYNAATGDLIYDSNGNAGGGDAVFAALLPHTVINQTDFLVV